ncbi:hypothetical protein, partial [Methylocapsa sp. S129]|uniref:hypothetical protein n=1 Tax=Methylocapsa sp. S129 TaxID=1641869 RepID=UPI001AED7A41
IPIAKSTISCPGPTPPPSKPWPENIAYDSSRRDLASTPQTPNAEYGADEGATPAFMPEVGLRPYAKRDAFAGRRELKNKTKKGPSLRLALFILAEFGCGGRI